MTQLALPSPSATVLLVEDSTINVVMAMKSFRTVSIPHEVHVAVDGDDAMAFLRAVGDYADRPWPDLVLLDLNMPNKDGHAVLQEMKSDVELRSIPVIILTTSESETDIRQAYDQHANAYVIKPICLHEWQQLVQTIARFWLELAKRPSHVRQECRDQCSTAGVTGRDLNVPAGN